MERLGNRIAFLATGDEIINGDILDTNAPHLAKQLIDHHFVPGIRLIVSDDQREMTEAIQYLLKDHAVVITIGGLGPTSDDRTRFAVSEAIDKSLEFDEPSWQRIVDKLSAYNLSIPENNRQQCLFPKDAEIYSNLNGTASGCCIPYNEKLIFMVPGPPNECRSMFENNILPRLLKTNLQEEIYRQSWMLLGVSEGTIAKTLNALMENSDCDIGYRVSYPYLEVKLQGINKAEFEQKAAQIEAEIKDRLVSRGKQLASELLSQWIETHEISFSIDDRATQGRLASTLVCPNLYNKLFFKEKNANIEVIIEGLSEYWLEKDDSVSLMMITLKQSEKTILNHTINIPMRGNRTPKYAVELFCEWLYNYLLTSVNDNPKLTN